MTTEAERLIRAANAWENGHTQIGPDMVSPQMLRDAAADIERLSALADKWNDECDEFREDNKRLASERDKANTLLRQALDAMRELDGYWPDIDAAITAIKQHLGEV